MTEMPSPFTGLVLLSRKQHVSSVAPFPLSLRATTPFMASRANDFQLGPQLLQLINLLATHLRSAEVEPL